MKFDDVNAVLPVNTKVSVPVPPVIVSFESKPALAIVIVLVPLPVTIVSFPVPAVMISLPLPLPVILNAVVNALALTVIPAEFNMTFKPASLLAFVPSVTPPVYALKSRISILVTLVNMLSFTVPVPVIFSVLEPKPPLIISALERFPTA